VPDAGVSVGIKALFVIGTRMRSYAFAALIALAATAEIIEVDEDTVFEDGEYLYREFIEGEEDCDVDDEVDEDMYVSIHFDARIDNTSATGEKWMLFSSTREDNVTYKFQVGQEKTLHALDEGLVGICPGATVDIIVPPSMGFGQAGMPYKNISGDATLRFQVTVMVVSEEPFVPENLFRDLDVDGDTLLSKDELLAFFTERGGDDAQIPDGLWENEDADGDDVISWDEFHGTKGLPYMSRLDQELYEMRRAIENEQIRKIGEAWNKLGTISNGDKSEEQQTKDEP